MNVPAAQEQTRHLVAGHLSHRGIVAPAPARPDAPARHGAPPQHEAPPQHGAPARSAAAARQQPGRATTLGLPGITLDSAGGVTAFGGRCRPQERRLADLLTAGAGAGRYFADRPALEAAHRTGYDPVLYHAFRDFFPPRELASGECLPAGTPGYDIARGSGYLFADLIVYQPGTLPGGEPFRSTGHWNLPWQLEVFQTLTGRVLMLVAGYGDGGQPFRYEQVCGPGQTMAVPFGVWHVSYVLDGPAAVFNVSADLSALAGERGNAAARQGPAKYRRAEPLAATIRRRGSGYDVVGSLIARRQRQPPGSQWSDWLQPFLAGAGSLAELHLFASAPELASFQRAAMRSCRPGRPTRPRSGQETPTSPGLPAPGSHE